MCIRDSHIAMPWPIASEQCRMHVVRSSHTSCVQLHAQAQVGGDGRSQRAASAVAFQGKAWVQNFTCAGCIAVHVHDVLRARQVAPFEQHRLRHLGTQGLGCTVHVIGAAKRMAAEQFGFRQVGGDDRGQWQQACAQCVQCGILQQFRAAGGNHHRVQHHMRGAGVFQRCFLYTSRCV